MKKYLIRIELIINRKFIGCFGAVADDKQKIISVAPMGKWWKGKYWSQIAKTYSNKKYNGTSVQVMEINKGEEPKPLFE